MSNHYIKQLFFLSIVLFSCGRNSKTLCSAFHTGKFVSHQALSQTVVLSRNDSVQIETNQQTGHVAKCSIKWISECEYQLTDCLEKDNASDTFRPSKPYIPITTRLIDVQKNFCVYESQMEGVSMKLTDTLWIMKESN